MKLKPLIVSIKGIKLTKKEKILLKKEKPWGVILFKRNLKTFTQIKDLIIQINELQKVIIQKSNDYQLLSFEYENIKKEMDLYL